MFILKNTKGFTLIELLIVVLLLALLSTAALSGFIGSQDAFDFFAKQKDISSTIRTIRTFAVTDKEMASDACGEDSEASAKRYAAEITENKLTIYADTCAAGAYFLDDKDKIIKELDFSNTGHGFQVLRAGDFVEMDFPVNLAYERKTSEFSIRSSEDSVLLPKDLYKYIAIRFYETEGDLESFIVILQVSGVPENFNNLNSL